MRRNVTIVVAAVMAVVSWSSFSLEASEGEETADRAARVVIQVDSVVAAGSEFTASIMLPDTTDSLGGFTLMLEYDFDAIVVDSAVPGSLIAGEWEYFSYRTGLTDGATSVGRNAYLRLVAIAEQHDPDGKSPSARSKYGAGELVRIHLYTTESNSYLNKTTRLRFFWEDCTSNSFSDPSGNQSYLSRLVFDSEGNLLAQGENAYSGAGGRWCAGLYNLSDEAGY